MKVGKTSREVRKLVRNYGVRVSETHVKAFFSKRLLCGYRYIYREVKITRVGSWKRQASKLTVCDSVFDQAAFLRIFGQSFHLLQLGKRLPFKESIPIMPPGRQGGSFCSVQVKRDTYKKNRRNSI